MLRGFKDIDRILRGEVTRIAAVRDGTLKIPLGGVSLATLTLGLSYGFFMGWFALINRETPVYQQLLATTLKVPLLFLLTLVVTFPSLYVFNALVGSRLTAGAVFRLLMAGLAVTLAVLASFGPITAFFSITTDNYSFMVLLNVMLFAVAGILGLSFLLRTLQRLSIALGEVARAIAPPPAQNAKDGAANGAGSAPKDAAPPESSRAEPGPLEPLEGHVLGSHVKAVFRCWVVIFALVGAQMSWVLRPFIGDPKQPFEWFRGRESNFFEALLNTIQSLVQ